LFADTFECEASFEDLSYRFWDSSIAALHQQRANEDAIYLRCEGTYVLTNEESPPTPFTTPSSLVHIYKMASASLRDLDSNIPGVMRWGLDRCSSKTISCNLTPEAFTLNGTSENDLGQIIIDTKFTVDRSHGMFSGATRFPLKKVRQTGVGTRAAIANPLR
jgi:hypothetical protein